MSDLYERLDLAIDSDPLKIVPIVRAEIADRDAEIQRLQAERDEQTARIDSAYEAFVDMAQANGGLSRSAEKLTHVSRIMSSLTGHETPQRVAYNRVWAEVERLRADLEQSRRGGKELGRSVVFLTELIKDAYVRGADDPIDALQMLGDVIAEQLEDEGGLSADEFNRVQEALRDRRTAEERAKAERDATERDAVAAAVRRAPEATP